MYYLCVLALYCALQWPYVVGADYIHSHTSSMNDGCIDLCYVMDNATSAKYAMH